jgi:hypothetical protein
MTPAMKQFNDAVEEFDRMTAFSYDQITSVGVISDLCAIRGRHDLAEIIFNGGENLLPVK